MYWKAMAVMAAFAGSLTAHPTFAEAQLEILEEFVREADRHARRSKRKTEQALSKLPRLSLGQSYELDELYFIDRDCSASTQFPNALWCSTTQVDEPYSRTSAIVLNDNRLAYQNFDIRIRGYRASRLRKLVKNLPKGAKEVELTPGPTQSSFVYLWGDLELKELDEAAKASLSKGKSPKKGILLDHLNDFEHSARAGLPIYFVKSGAGTAWIANVTSKGQLTVRTFVFDHKLATTGETTDAETPLANTQHVPQPDFKTAKKYSWLTLRNPENPRYIFDDMDRLIARLPDDNETTRNLLKKICEQQSKTDRNVEAKESLILQRDRLLQSEINKELEACRSPECTLITGDALESLERAVVVAVATAKEEANAARRFTESQEKTSLTTSNLSGGAYRAGITPSKWAENLVIYFLIFLAIWIYFFPAWSAFRRRHSNRWLILLLNALGGVTLYGWFYLLLWSRQQLHISEYGSNGGESGLNFFVNDFTPRPHRKRRKAASGKELQSLLRHGLIDKEQYTAAKKGKAIPPPIPPSSLSEKDL